MDKNFFQPRKLKFKAWNDSTGLMMRLHAIDCVKGELVKKDHQLLQFTGMVDKQGEELYELDVVMIDVDRYCIHWDDTLNGWMLRNLGDGRTKAFHRGSTENAIRLWNYLESAAKQP
jgi:YopX protein